MPDVYAGHDSEEEALRLAAQSLFDSLAQGLTSRQVQVAIRTGDLGALTQSPQWRKAVQHLAESLTPAQVSLVEAGLLSGIEEIASKAPRLSPKIGKLARRDGGRRAVALAKDLDKTTSAGLRRLIKRASKEYVASQQLKTLRTLEKEIRQVVGVTAKQAARIERWRLAAVKSGMPPQAISSGVASRTATAKAIRAKAIAERGVIESVAYGRHQSWVEAVKAGDLPPNVKKRWRTQNDSKVRASHRAQAAVGPIPLDDIYEIQGVMHPPSPDRGCRCSESLVMPEAVEAPTATTDHPTGELAQVSDNIRGITRTLEADTADIDRDLRAADVEAGQARNFLGSPNQLDFLDPIVRGLDPGVQNAVLDSLRETYQEQLDAALIRKASLLERRKAFEAAARSKAHAELRLPKERRKLVLDRAFIGKADRQRKAAVREALDWLEESVETDRPLRNSLEWLEASDEGKVRPLQFTAVKEDRSHLLWNQVNLGPGSDSGTVVHELGHWLERDKKLLERSVEFLVRRTKGDVTRQLSDILPDHGYGASEVARADKFTHPYTGKVYPESLVGITVETDFGNLTATEILSMGLESMFRDPVRFLVEDEDFFTFILEFMRGARR